MVFTSQTQQVPTCWNYVRGRCERRNCKYAHPPGICFPPYNHPSPFGPSQPHPLPPESVVRKGGKEVIDPVLSGEDQSVPTVYYKPIAWKTAPCRHFTRTGTCPVGRECRFVHDVELMRVEADTLKENQNLSLNEKLQHCWSFVQGDCRNSSCRYLHPTDIQPYKKYTPCLAWPMCPYGNQCHFKHPEPIKDTQKTRSKQDSGKTAESMIYSGPQSALSVLFSSPTVAPVVPREINGTTYYPVSPPLPFHSPGNMQVAGNRDTSYFNSVSMGNAMIVPSDWRSLPYTQAQAGTSVNASPPVEFAQGNHGVGSDIWTASGTHNPIHEALGSLPAVSSSKAASSSNLTSLNSSQKKFRHARRISVAIKNPSRTE